MIIFLLQFSISSKFETQPGSQSWGCMLWSEAVEPRILSGAGTNAETFKNIFCGARAEKILIAPCSVFIGSYGR